MTRDELKAAWPVGTEVIWKPKQLRNQVNFGLNVHGIVSGYHKTGRSLRLRTRGGEVVYTIPGNVERKK